MVCKIIFFIVCVGIGIFMCCMPYIEQRNDEKLRKHLSELNDELYQIMKSKKEQKKNA